MKFQECLVWLSGFVFVVCLTTGLVFGLVARKRYNELQHDFTDAKCSLQNCTLQRFPHLHCQVTEKLYPAKTYTYFTHCPKQVGSVNCTKYPEHVPNTGDFHCFLRQDIAYDEKQFGTLKDRLYSNISAVLTSIIIGLFCLVVLLIALVHCQCSDRSSLYEYRPLHEFSDL